MKKKFWIWTLLVLAAINLGLYVAGYKHIYRALYYNFVDIDDYKIFENNVIKASTNPQPWVVAQNVNAKSSSQSLNEFHQKLQSIAYLVIKNNTIVQEQYWDGYGIGSKSNSFSVAKSFVAALIGVAIKDGLIDDVKDPVGKYVQEYNTGGKQHITIENVLQMSSGLSWDEGYASPFSMTTEGYYGWELEELILDLDSIEAPGKRWYYRSGDTELLGIILKRVTGKTLSQYAHEKLWQPMGFENDALWCLDRKDGIEKAYCCINTDARDFARLGKLYLQNGKWNDTQILDSSYIAASLTSCNIPYQDGEADHYGYHWWLIPDYKGHNIFYARGILGQYVIVIPEKNIIIVRLGKDRGEKKVGTMHHEITFAMIDDVLNNY